MLALASRWGFLYFNPAAGYRPEDIEQSAFGWWDLEVRAIDHIGVTSLVNSEGYTLEINIKALDELPELGVPGIEIVWDLTHPTIGDQQQREERRHDPQTQAFTWDQHTSIPGQLPFRHWPIIPDPGPILKTCVSFAVTECYLFPLRPVGFARFNGEDSYIKLDNLMTFVNNPFRLSCEVKLNQTVNHWPICGKQGTGGFFGMEGDDIVFGFLQLDTSWDPVTDVWLTWVYEFESETQLQHKLTIAGDVVRDATFARQNFGINTLGVYREGVSGTLWADMDMRNLKIESGTPGDYTTLLDMPLFENALDVGPLGNHGTTFNMALPSV